MYISKYISQDVEIELEDSDVVEYIENADDAELRDFKERINELLDEDDDVTYSDVKEYLTDVASKTELKRLKVVLDKALKS